MMQFRVEIASGEALNKYMRPGASQQRKKCLWTAWVPIGSGRHGITFQYKSHGLLERLCGYGVVMFSSTLIPTNSGNRWCITSPPQKEPSSAYPPTNLSTAKEAGTLEQSSFMLISCCFIFNDMICITLME